MREIQADIPIMIHLDNGGFNEMYVEWFDEFTKRAEPFDIIGFPYLLSVLARHDGRLS